MGQPIAVVAGNSGAFPWYNSGQPQVALPQPQQLRLQSGQCVAMQMPPQPPYMVAMGPPPAGATTIMLRQLGPPPYPSGTDPLPSPSTMGHIGIRKQVPVTVEVVSSSGAPPSQQNLELSPAQTPIKLSPAQTPIKAFPTRSYVPPHVPNRVPTIPGVEHLEPITVYNLLREGGNCILVDLRSDDRAAGLIEGALHIPAVGNGCFPARLPELTKEWANQELVILTCQYSAHRAPQCANWYRQQTHAGQRVAILSGGFRGWEGNGFPVQAYSDEKKPMNTVDDLALQLGKQFLESLPQQVSTPQASAEAMGGVQQAMAVVGQPVTTIQSMPTQDQFAQIAPRPQTLPAQILPSQVMSAQLQPGSPVPSA